ncbi:prepilin peptidase [Primorskyibacter sp. 2E107]|uniref:prepilin peptidase n=1 Tax=Primorskyibacter sp. 2E107 TaxID=3403458 RepID=UPI003AF92164
MSVPVLLLIVLAPAIGSFLGVLVDRLPRGEDVVRRRSACRSCGAGLAARDLVPVLSFALAQGRCRHCGTALPTWLLYMEISALGLALCAVAAGFQGVALWLNTVLLWLLMALFVADIVWMRLPDLLNAALFLCTLSLAIVPGGAGVAAALIGAATGLGAFLLLRVGYRALRGREGLGMGDVKLMAGLGAFAGVFHLPLLVFLASVGALGLVLAQRVMARQGLPGGAERLPFGAALCAAAGLIWILRAAMLIPA